MTIEQVFECESVADLRKEIERLRQLAFNAGICTDCGGEVSHDISEPFAQCDCNACNGECGTIPTIPLLRYNLYVAEQAIITAWNRLDGMWCHHQDGSDFCPKTSTEAIDQKVADKLGYNSDKLNLMKLFDIVQNELRQTFEKALSKSLRNKLNGYVPILDFKEWSIGVALEEKPPVVAVK